MCTRTNRRIPHAIAGAASLALLQASPVAARDASGTQHAGAAYGGWLLLGLVVVLILYRLLRGRTRIENGWAGFAIRRFTAIERIAHWMLALSFLVLAASGLVTLYGPTALVPLVGPAAYATIAAACHTLHALAIVPFIAGLVMTFDLLVGQNWPTLTDIKWLLRGGGLFMREGRPPAGKFNAAQKAYFWLVALGGIMLSVTGVSLLLKLPLLGWLMGSMGLGEELRLAASWHIAAALVLTAATVVHIFARAIASEGALDAMTTGEVDLNWARERHSLWAGREIAKLEAERRRRANTAPGAAE